MKRSQAAGKAVGEAVPSWKYRITQARSPRKKPTCRMRTMERVGRTIVPKVISAQTVPMAMMPVRLADQSANVTRDGLEKTIPIERASVGRATVGIQAIRAPATMALKITRVQEAAKASGGGGAPPGGGGWGGGGGAVERAKASRIARRVTSSIERLCRDAAEVKEQVRRGCVGAARSKARTVG